MKIKGAVERGRVFRQGRSSAGILPLAGFLPPHSLKACRCARPSTSGAATGLEQEPGALLGLIRPVVENSRGAVVAGGVDDLLRLAQGLDERQIVAVEFGEPVLGAYELRERT